MPINTAVALLVFLYAFAMKGADAGSLYCEGPSRDGRCPPPVADDWRGLEAIPPSQLRLWSSKQDSGFETGTHADMTSAASKKCSTALVHAQYRQDSIRQFDSSAHFDNCAFKESLAAIDGEIRAIDSIFAGKKSPADSLDAVARIGKILHAVQDFYAHSNWVELQSSSDAEFGPALVVPVWLPAGRERVLNAAGLVSGYVWWDRPQVCAAGVAPHSLMAKDTASSPSGKQWISRWRLTAYKAAIKLAEFATADFMAWAYARWPGVARECQAEVYVLVQPDRRSDP